MLGVVPAANSPQVIEFLWDNGDSGYGVWWVGNLDHPLQTRLAHYDSDSGRITLAVDESGLVHSIEVAPSGVLEPPDLEFLAKLFGFNEATGRESIVTLFAPPEPGNWRSAIREATVNPAFAQELWANTMKVAPNPDLGGASVG